MKKVAFIFVFIVMCMFVSCETVPTSDDIQKNQQEEILKEATAQTGMPNLKNFRERKMMKRIIELCDQEGVVTYTYLENMNPVIIRGRTALGGKLTFLAQTIGYGLPYATQYTNPLKVESRDAYGTPVINQADPSGLYKPASAEGTWILVMNPDNKQVEPAYIEPRICSFPYKLPLD